MSLFQTMLDEPIEPTLPDLAAPLGNQDLRHILQHHRLQCEATRTFPMLDQGVPTQAVNGFEHPHARQGRNQ
jgi:hypothetical protein